MGRDIQAIKISGEDRRKYRDKVRRSLDAFARMLRERAFDENPSMVGQEIELNLVDARGMPSMRNADVLEVIADPAWATEVGQFNLEINVPPRQLGGDALGGLERRGPRRPQRRGRQGPHASAAIWSWSASCRPWASWTWPRARMSANERYRVLNEQIFAARGEDMRIAIDGAEQLETHADSITPEAACTSVQLHVQVSPDAFANYWNAAQAIAGVQVALGANSPFLFGRQLWHETRITLFEQATDTRPDELKEQGVRPRVWFGERWITSVFDLFEENLRYFPALLPICEDEDPLAVLDDGASPQLAEMNLHNGTIYRWNRPVYGVVDGTPHLRVENRVLPGGPTIADVMANAAFYYGLVRYLAEAQRPIWTQLSFATAAENLHEARAPRPGRAAVLAGRRGHPGRRARPAPPAAAGPRGAQPVGGQPGPRRPAARHHRAALPHRADRRRLADRRGGRADQASRPGPRGGAAADDPALHRAHAHQRAGAHLAAGVLSTPAADRYLAGLPVSASGPASVRWRSIHAARAAAASSGVPLLVSTWSGMLRRSHRPNSTCSSMSRLRQGGRPLMRARRSSSGQSRVMIWMSPIQRRAGSSWRCPGMNGPSSTVGIPDWAAPWAMASHASRNAGQLIGWLPLSAPAASMSKSVSKVTQRPCSLRASGARTAVLPEPEAPVTMNSGLSAAASSARPHSGQTACPLRGSMATGLSQDWQ